MYYITPSQHDTLHRSPLGGAWVVSHFVIKEQGKATMVRSFIRLTVQCDTLYNLRPKPTMMKYPLTGQAWGCNVPVYMVVRSYFPTFLIKTADKTQTLPHNPAYTISTIQYFVLTWYGPQ